MSSDPEPDTAIEMTTAELGELGAKLLASGFFREVDEPATDPFEMEA